MLEQLQIEEIILAGNYYENFKYEKDMAQFMGGNHPKVLELNKELNKMREQWNFLKEKIKHIQSGETIL